MSDQQEDPELTFYTVAKVAQIFEVTEQTVRTWVKKGDLEAVKLPNSSYRIKRSTLIEFARTKYNIKGPEDEGA